MGLLANVGACLCLLLGIPVLALPDLPANVQGKPTANVSEPQSPKA